MILRTTSNVGLRVPRGLALCLALAGISLIACGVDDGVQDNSNANNSNRDEPVDRAEFGPPPMVGSTVDLEGHPFLAGMFLVETTQLPTIAELDEIVSPSGGSVCGASVHSDVFFVCLPESVSTGNELIDVLASVQDHDLVASIGPINATPVLADAGDLNAPCVPVRSHLNRLEADTGAQLLQDSGVSISSLAPVTVIDVGFHWLHQDLVDHWAGQPLDFGGYDNRGPAPTLDSGCAPGVEPKSFGAEDCDVYFHDPDNRCTTDHGTTVASAAGGSQTGLFPGLAITALKSGTDFLTGPLPGQNSRHPASLSVAICLAAESAIAQGAEVINISATIQPYPVLGEDYLAKINKPIYFCSFDWWRQQMELLDARSGVLVTTTGNNGKDLDVELETQTLTNLPGVIVVGASTRDGDSPSRLDDGWNTGVRSGYRSSTPLLYAPGEQLCLAAHDSVGEWPSSDSNDDYNLMSGTSFAAPQVAALVSAIKTLAPGLSAAGIEEHLLDTGTLVIDGRGPNPREINVRAAIAALLPPPCNHNGLCEPPEDVDSCPDDCPLVCNPGTMGGVAHDYIIQQVYFPMSTQEAGSNGLDVDGDGSVDNKLGGFYSMLSWDPNLEAATALAAGDLVLLSRITDDGGATNSVTIQLLRGASSTAPAFNGTDVINLAPGFPTEPWLCGGWSPPQMSAAPGELIVHFPVVGLDPVSWPAIPTVLTRVETVPSLYPGSEITEAGWIDVIVGGAISQTMIQQSLLPSWAIGMNQLVASDPSAGQTYLDLFDGACNTSQAGCAAADTDPNCAADGQITALELQCNSLFASMIAPDIDTDNDGVKDALSFGYRFVAAVPANIIGF